MDNTLFIGDYAYSSWSLRGWLLFEKFGVPATLRTVDFNDARGVAEQMAEARPARTVPTLVADNGAVIWDSLAMAEELASRYPDAGHWPKDPCKRALARSLAAEMHSGFTALRGDCPMNLRAAYAAVPVSEALAADLRRLELIWDHARTEIGGDGPWLCGEYSAVDAFFAPVAARIAGYGLPVSDSAQTYVAAHLNDPAFRRWRALGLLIGDDLPWYARDYPQVGWPGPAPLPATPKDHGPAKNDACMFSGRPVTHFFSVGDQVFGTCNVICRDKVIADPLAWPEFTKINQS